MNTRKFPRTMTEAFGPYTSQIITEPIQPPMDPMDKVVLAVCAACAVFVFVLVVLE